MRILPTVLAILAATSSIAIAGNCTLCADGSNSTFPAESSTCNNLLTTAEALYSGSDGCLEIQSHSFRYCGCPSPQPPENPTCTLCPGGAEPLYGDKDIGDGFTCSNLATYLLFEKDEDTCSQNQRLHGLSCGCRSDCTGLCAEGSEPSEESSLNTVSDFKCSDVESLFGKVFIQSSECSQYQYLGIRSCQCAEPAGASPICDLCQDGNIPPNWNLDVSTRKNCLQIAGEAAFDPVAQGHCSAYQAGFGPYCGCNNNNAPDICRICGGDNLLSEPNRIADLATSDSCAQVEMEANKDGANCSAIQDQYASACCSTDALYEAAEKDCSICSDGSFPIHKDLLVYTLFGVFTCGQIAHFPSIIPDVFCRPLQNILEKKCGCGTHWITLAPTTSPAPPTSPPTSPPTPPSTSPPTVSEPSGNINENDQEDECRKPRDSCDVDSACCAGYYCSNDGVCEECKKSRDSCNVDSECCTPGYHCSSDGECDIFNAPRKFTRTRVSSIGNFIWDNHHR